ncbi:hypothetical protein ACFQJ7_00615 [Halovenus rubra]|uniref:Uncharacterized protein n=2 Tax=Halovenus rubra TaxID=869890 RepID=A0ABD5X022_9EURY|nr:hypothetical protein [Halovenus rubra]
MSEDTEIDPDLLREEVSQIKDAMGIQERYPSRFRFWLVTGLAVLLASSASQLIALRELSGSLHAVAWWVPLGVAGLYQWWSTDNSDATVTEAKPRIGVLWLSVFALYFVFLVTLTPVLDGMNGAAGEILLFSLIVGLVGVGYLVVGEALRAYYIRRRDRWAFYIGGGWMLTLAALMPNVDIFQTWGYATFGIAFAIHAVVSYLALK